MFNIFPIDGGISAVEGFFCDGVSAGLKPNDKFDVSFIYSDTLCEVEAIFTTNKFQAAPIKHFKKYGYFKTNFVLINAKNANAMTGEAGINDIDEVLSIAKDKFNVINPIMSSTGVIGVRLPKEKIINAMDKFDLNTKNGSNLSQAIMTTDAFAKEIALEVVLDSGEKFRIGASAKGAGMINPAMATMLCFIATDSAIPKDEMREILNEINEISFNAISVDGDTSTNDTVLLLSNQKAIYNKDAFKQALKIIMQKLAILIVKDGEGANSVVAFNVKGAKNLEEAKKISKALSTSLLVKTAIFGKDPNWGRIASTIGASGCDCDETTLKIYFEDILIYDRGNIYFDKENEAKASKVMNKDEFKIICNLGLGEGEFTSFGCDLGYEYVKINADYRT